MTPTEPTGFFNIGNSNTDITFEGNIYPAGRNLFFTSNGDGSNITLTDNLQQEAPSIQFKNSGFSNDIDWRTITFWAAKYDNTPTDLGLNKDGEFIPYALNDIVIYYDTSGNTKFFKCIQAHAGNYNPNSSPAYWTQITWNGRNMPPLDLRIEKDTYYYNRGMGLTYNEDTSGPSAEYDEWISKYDLNDTDAMAGADIENDGLGDGYNNLAEYALGMNPTNSDAGSRDWANVATQNGTNWFEYVHYRRTNYVNEGLSYRLIDSTNLMDSITTTNTQNEIHAGPALNGYEPVTNRYLINDPIKYIRLNISTN